MINYTTSKLRYDEIEKDDYNYTVIFEFQNEETMFVNVTGQSVMPTFKLT